MAGIKIYYRRVQMKRGVAVSWDEVEVLEPASKKSKRQFTFSEEAEQASDIWNGLSTRELVDVSDDSEAPQEGEQAGSAVQPPAQEETEQAGSAGEPPAQEESPRAETPEWLVALDSGFRCLACCRVFPSLEVLQDHVDSAVREGFSCRVFHHEEEEDEEEDDDDDDDNDDDKEEEEEEENRCMIL
ncbi:protein FAM170A-like [Manis pentadactyla]|uniref:protein FAM170A-like n=1 Tax=Manis pentadactyla TaxID=143292 RepID=UPI00255CD3A1|nr:protein FAM170A-like [Manis pentadactyla]